MIEQRANQNGFSLIELLIVIVIFGIFMGAVYSLYVTHLKTAITRDEIIDVQQNVRIAMDIMSRDLRMAGFLFPEPVDAAMSNYSSINIQTATADGTFVAIKGVIQNDKFSVTPTTALDNISTKNNDTVGIYRPSTRAQIGAVFTVISSSSGSGNITVSPANDTVRVGDMICKNPNRIRYIVDRSDTAEGCNILPCLKRNGNVIAQGIKNIRFDYFLNGDNTTAITNVPAEDVAKITAIRVTVIGHTLKNQDIDDPSNTRELKSLIKLRNFR
ncbi:MAG: prepilin-type N-terminal cleavage/methylation domain-containing protein [Desulfuromonadaceae bacterium]|nr:prepilin-type N-terminal cleavage/methylation domain-containing protein [Desulfuromonadaceae bacterium]MDD2855151.1 prepilin-type N-terminal cleavage/methylation domain-containing protein [Desulfuromonadaceae bacterium]